MGFQNIVLFFSKEAFFFHNSAKEVLKNLKKSTLGRFIAEGQKT
jgi:hypothetical protein